MEMFPRQMIGNDQEMERTDSDNVLVDDTASTDVEMADLRVTHQTLGQTDRRRGSLELSVASLTLGKAVHRWALGVCDGISVLGRVLARHTPPIDDD
jgi:hypothetical protein